MSFSRFILSWFGIGFVCMLIGTISDYTLHNKKPDRKVMDYVFPILVGWIGAAILLRSIYRGIRIKLKK